jgi:hypothetical protein
LVLRGLPKLFDEDAEVLGGAPEAYLGGPGLVERHEIAHRDGVDGFRSHLKFSELLRRLPDDLGSLSVVTILGNCKSQ